MYGASLNDIFIGCHNPTVARIFILMWHNGTLRASNGNSASCSLPRRFASSSISAVGLSEPKIMRQYFQSPTCLEICCLALVVPNRNLVALNLAFDNGLYSLRSCFREHDSEIVTRTLLGPQGEEVCYTDVFVRFVFLRVAITDYEGKEYRCYVCDL